MLTRSLSVLDVPSEDRVAIEAVLAGHQDMRRRKSIAMSIDSGTVTRGGEGTVRALQTDVVIHVRLRMRNQS